MITSNDIVQAAADTEGVAKTSSGAPTDLTQDTLRQVAEAVRGAFPRPSGDCELVLVDVDPRHLHAFWNLPADPAAHLHDQVALTDESPPLVLRITEVSPQGKPGDCFDIEVLGLQGQFYVDIWGDARRYQGAIGLRQPDGSLAVLARSNVVELPRGGPSGDSTWREIALPAPPTMPRPRAARPHAPTFTPAPAASTPSPAAVNGTSLAAGPASVSRGTAATGTTPVPADETATAAAMPLAVATVPTVAPEAGGAAPPTAAPNLGGTDRFEPAPTANTATVAPGAPGAADTSPLLLGEPAEPVQPKDATQPAPEPAPALSPPPAPVAGELAAAIARHETEAVAPLAAFPYYEPEAAEHVQASPPSEEPPAPPASSEPATAAETAPAASEGPEPVPVPLENVLTLSSFAVAGGAVEFEINAELHIFGRAKTGMKLEMFGRPVPIRPDGSFSINRPLPNGALVLSVLLAKNGERKE